MNFFQAMILAVVQGLTEFLPVSSSGHLVILQRFFGLTPPILFDVLVHVGTLLAILFFFREKYLDLIIRLRRKEKNALVLFRLLVIGTIPAVLVGLFLEKKLVAIFGSVKLVGVSFLLTAAILFFNYFLEKRKKLEKGLDGVKPEDALTIGLAQALAILPGVSRSGTTITAGLRQGLSRETAFFFSFLLAVPAIFGALSLQLVFINGDLGDLRLAMLAVPVAGFCGYLALLGLKKIWLGGRMWLFGFYCLGLGLLLLFMGF